MTLWHAAIALGALPLLALAGMRVAGRRVGSAWWWLAVAFGVSCIADLVDALVPGVTHPLVSQLYPLSQAAIVLFVLLPTPHAIAVVLTLFAVSGASLAIRGGTGLDLALHILAWSAVAKAAYRVLSPGVLRNTLLYGFGALVVTWTWFYLTPTFAAWGALQAVRLAMAAGFAWAAWQGTTSTKALT